MIFAIKPFEIHDGDGIRTTVFFKGCPLRCKWCHNPESFSFTEEPLFEQQRNDSDPVQIAKQVCKDKLFFQNSGGGVTFSGGEPLMQIDLCVALASLLKEQQINIAIDTSGFVPREHIERILPYADTFLFDIKAIDRDVHMACTGVPNEQILSNIKYVDTLGVPMEIRYPYVPTMNDKEWEKIADFVKELKNMTLLRILPYHNYAEQKYYDVGIPEMFHEYPVPPLSEIDDVIRKIKERGVPNVGRF